MPQDDGDVKRRGEGVIRWQVEEGNRGGGWGEM